MPSPDFSKLNRFPTANEITESLAEGARIAGHPFDKEACQRVIEAEGVESVVRYCLESFPARDARGAFAADERRSKLAKRRKQCLN